MHEKIKGIQERNKGIGGECEEMQLASKWKEGANDGMQAASERNNRIDASSK
jgi:hypothetical protein